MRKRERQQKCERIIKMSVCEKERERKLERERKDERECV